MKENIRQVSCQLSLNLALYIVPSSIKLMGASLPRTSEPSICLHSWLRPQYSSSPRLTLLDSWLKKRSVLGKLLVPSVQDSESRGGAAQDAFALIGKSMDQSMAFSLSSSACKLPSELGNWSSTSPQRLTGRLLVRVRYWQRYLLECCTRQCSSWYCPCVAG